MFLRTGLDLAQTRRVGVLAAGGTGMNPLAHLLMCEGVEVCAVDARPSPALEGLKGRAASVSVGRLAMLDSCQAIVVSTAIRNDDPDVLAAVELGIPIYHRHALLEALGSRRSTLAISGTHGKTTSSALMAHVLTAAGERPSFLVGAVVNAFGTSWQWNDSTYFVLEADESDSTFLAAPRVGALVTNVEADHLDHHQSMDQLRAAFARFSEETDGPVVVCGDDDEARRLPHSMTYGCDAAAEARITNLVRSANGSRWTLELPGESLDLSIGVPGHHLVLNASGVAALAFATGVPPEGIAEGVSAYKSAARRFEFRGARRGVRFIDDYAHMPAEVRAVLDAVGDHPSGRVVVLFQPHRYTRTAEVWAEYEEAFRGADVVLITEIYAAGETPIPGVDGAAIARRVRVDQVEFCPTLADAADWLSAHLREGDLCLTLGAGDVTEVATIVLDRWHDE